MANKAISELPQAQNVNNQDLFVLEQSGIAKKLPAETFITEQGIIDALAEALDGHGGIQSVTLSSVSGRIRTYRITFTDQSATTFQVYDGTSIDRISRTSSSGLDDVYTIFLSDGTTTFFTVHNGADGNVSEAMLNDALKNKAPAVTETTESSAIANFPDGADDMPMYNVVAEINPMQDLTYGDPYPAGGGKNKLPPGNAGTASNNGVTYASDGNGSYTLSGTATADSTIKYTLPTPYTIVSGDYLHMMNLTANTSIGMILDFDDETSAYPTFSSASRIFDLASRVGKTIMAIGFTVGNGNAYSGTITPMVINSATPTTFAPYSNICPISGWTGCNVTRMGKNLCPTATITLGNGSPRTADVYFAEPLPIGTYRFSASVTTNTSASANPGVEFLPSNANAGSVAISAGTTGTLTKTFTITKPLRRMYFYLGTTDYNNGKTVVFENIQVEVGSTITTYEPYIAPTTIPLSWQTEAGTVYGGTIDVATGLLTVDRAMVDLGTLAWAYRTSGSTLAPYFLTDVSAWGVKYEGNFQSVAYSLLCSMYKVVARGNFVDETLCVDGATGTSQVTQIQIKDPRYTDANTFKAAMSGVQLVYELATPQTYQLTPQEVLHTLYGTNNVWTDIGNVSVTYPADTKMFIEKLTMPTEDDMVANQAIASGTFFMVGQKLYLSIASIASGAQIIEGTNARQLSLADALNTINS